MPPPKFKLRLGSQEYLSLAGQSQVSDRMGDAYRCRLSLRTGALQASSSSLCTAQELRAFINSLVGVVASLRGTCELVPSIAQAFSLRVAVADTGMIITEVKITTFDPNSLNTIGWNAHSRFQTPWSEYYHPTDVECLNVSKLAGIPGHIPFIGGQTHGEQG